MSQWINTDGWESSYWHNDRWRVQLSSFCFDIGGFWRRTYHLLFFGGGNYASDGSIGSRGTCGSQRFRLLPFLSFLNLCLSGVVCSFACCLFISFHVCPVSSCESRPLWGETRDGSVTLTKNICCEILTNVFLLIRTGQNREHTGRQSLKLAQISSERDGGSK